MLAALLFMTESASAACNPARPNLSGTGIAGWYTNSPDGALWYASGHIEQYDPNVPISVVGLGTTATVRIAFSNGGTQASVGWMKRNPSDPWYTACGTRCSFALYALQPSGIYVHYHTPARPIGEWTQYEIKWENCYGAQAFGFYLNGSRFGCNGHQNLLAHTRMYAVGSVNNAANQMPGGVNNRVDMDYLQYGSGGSYKDIGYNGMTALQTWQGYADTPPWWRTETVWNPAHHIRIWDDWCTS